MENNKPTTPNLNLNPPESVNECKSDIKLYLLMQPCYVNLREFELFCQTVVSQIHTGALLLSSATSYRVSKSKLTTFISTANCTDSYI